jgi:hypothetical protein
MTMRDKRTDDPLAVGPGQIRRPARERGETVRLDGVDTKEAV